MEANGNTKLLKLRGSEVFGKIEVGKEPSTQELLETWRWLTFTSP